MRCKKCRKRARLAAKGIERRVFCAWHLPDFLHLGDCWDEIAFMGAMFEPCLERMKADCREGPADVFFCSHCGEFDYEILSPPLGVLKVIKRFYIGRQPGGGRVIWRLIGPGECNDSLAA